MKAVTLATKTIKSKTSEPTWLQEIRADALKQYNELQYPNFRYGLTIRVDYSDLDVENIQNNLNNLTTEVPTFKNPAGLMKEGLIILPLKKALQSHENLIKPHLTKLIQHNHKFAQLHKAFFNGTFIHVPKNKKITKPLIINNNHNNNNHNSTQINHLFIVAESPITIIETRESAKRDNSTTKSNTTKLKNVQQQFTKQPFTSNATEIVVKNNATVNYISIQKYDNSTFNFDYKNAITEQNATINWIDFCLGSTFTHSTITSTLKGTGSKSTIKTVFFGDNNQRFDTGAQIINAAEHTQGNIATKGVLTDSAKNIYRGLIKIEQNAASSSGYQKEDVLMLSKDAEADSIPQLEIDNNDVKCSHAATTTHVDDERLFYLMARGLNKKSATKMFVQGFLDPFIEEINEPIIIEQIKKHIEERIK